MLPPKVKKLTRCVPEWHGPHSSESVGHLCCYLGNTITYTTTITTTNNNNCTNEKSGKKVYSGSRDTKS